MNERRHTQLFVDVPAVTSGYSTVLLVRWELISAFISTQSRQMFKSPPPPAHASQWHRLYRSCQLQAPIKRSVYCKMALTQKRCHSEAVMNVQNRSLHFLLQINDPKTSLCSMQDIWITLYKMQLHPSMFAHAQFNGKRDRVKYLNNVICIAAYF
jgi:hypothetical protein